MKIEKDYKNRSWKISSEYLDEPIYISFFKDIEKELVKIKGIIREKKLKELLKNQ